MFHKNKLSLAVVGALASSSFAVPAFAQDDQILEEIVVTGIRASMERAMDIKRDATGVVDAISAEDMGKFPDTNLAESLQRITGVSVDRARGEGSNVTIRGFGGANNLVLLNGRHMPAASAFGGNSGAGGARGFGSRSFDFSNIASEGVSGLEVYKTGKASISTGGIGGTINVKTTRPLDNPGMQGSVGVKAAHDTSALDDTVTPEVSGLFSWTDDDETFGVSLSASYQEREFGLPGAALNDWRVSTWEGRDAPGQLYSFTDDAVIENEPADGQLYARPNDIRLSFSEGYTERTNAQLTLQFKPMDNLTLTGDYTFAELYIEEHRGEQTFWFANGNSVNRLVFDDYAVKGPMIYSEVLSNKDNGYEQQYREQENTLSSFGFNADWQVNDSFSVILDVHDSSMESLPVGPGGSGSIDVSVAAPILSSQVAHFGGDIPTVATTINDSNTNNNGQWDLNDFGTQMGRIWYADQVTDITQVKLDGLFEFDNGKFEFGIDSRAMETTTRQSNNQLVLGNWGVTDAGQIPNELLTEFDLKAQFDDYDMSRHQDYAIRATDPVALMRWATDTYGYDFEVDRDFTTNNNLQEDTAAAYFQVTVEGELNGMATSLTTGLRYEDTDVTSTSLAVPPKYLLWEDNNDFRPITEGVERQAVTETAGYDNLLPQLDFSINFMDDLKGRFSYSKTIARAGYGQLSVAASGFGTNGSTLLGAQPRASASNPGLLPLESDNFDLALEWYYDDASYASAGVFEKRVSNFIGTTQVIDTHFGIQDQTFGPRARAARDTLVDNGWNVNDTNLFVMMGVQGSGDPWSVGDFATDGSGNVTTDFHQDVVNFYADTPAGGLIPQANDPLMEFLTSTPTNNREAKLYGAEFGVQHFFGDTGFGVQANYTIVRGDVGFDNLADPTENQFALTGLSDSANLIGIYEDYGWSVRLAYNWRDKFLTETNRGAGLNPTYVEEYGQIDMNVSYELTDNINVFFEGLNLTGENIRHHGRTPNQLWYLEDLSARYNLGARYTF